MNQAPVDSLNSEHEWRCCECGKLLGHLHDGRLYVRLARGHTYLVGFPVTTVCRGCRALNELAAASSLVARPKPPSAAASALVARPKAPTAAR